MTTLSLRDLNRATLARQMLLAREKTTIPKALARLLAIQAQWPKPPFVAFWTRLSGFEPAELTKLARKHAIVRGTAFRGTIFLMRPEDYAAFRASIVPALEKGIVSITGKHIPAADHAKLVGTSRKFFAKAPATFEALRDHLLAGGHPEATVRPAALVVRMRLPLLMMPTDASWGWPQSADFALAETLIEPEIAREAADDALVLRYLAALGPGTVADAQNFLGIAKLKDSFARLRPKLVTFSNADGKELFDLPDAPRPDAATEAPVRFLPDFDNCVLGHADRRRFVADEHKPRIYGANLSALRVFLVDGFAAGTWKCEAKKSKATLTLEPFAKLTKKARAALEEEGSALVRFLEPDAKAHDLAVAT